MRAVTSTRRPRSGRVATFSTSPTMTTSSSPWMSATAISSAAVSYRNGRCSRRSRTVSSPRLASLRRSVAPTPGSESSGASSRRGRGPPRVAGQAGGRSSPANTVCRRVSVITLSARATLTLTRRSDGVCPPEEADRPRTGVRADDGAERRLHLDRRLRPQVAHHLRELDRLLRRVGMGRPEAKLGPVRRPVSHGVDELLERLPVAAHALDRDHFAVPDGEDRLHVQELARERPCAADPAAACEELERL